MAAAADATEGVKAVEGQCTYFSPRSQRLCRGPALPGMPMCPVHMQKRSREVSTGAGEAEQDHAAQPPRNPNDKQCSFFVRRKQRFCRMPVSIGKVFCGEHAAAGDNLDGFRQRTAQGPGPAGAERIPCPMDPRHTVYRHRLERHLKKCSGKPAPLPEYHTPCINSSREPAAPPDPKLSLSELSTAELRALIERVRAAGEKHVPEIPVSVADHPVVRAEIERCQGEQSGACTHLEQQASLIGNMEQCGLLQHHRCFVEFGAGRGKLLHFVYRAVGADATADFLAVDRMRTRCKFDRFHKASVNSRLERVLIDIEHLDLKKVPLIRTGRFPLVALGKHLCGVATDLSLVCLANCPSPTERVAEDARRGAAAGAALTAVEEHASKRARLDAADGGVMIALCCHQVCTWSGYCNQQFFSETLGFDSREFKLIALMSSWYTCGTRAKVKDAPESTQPENDEPEHAHIVRDESTTARSGLTKQEQETVGFTCKRLIDIGRVLYLREKGYNARLISYTARETSLEHVALVATPSSPL